MSPSANAIDRCQRILVAEDNLTTSKMLALFLADAGYQIEQVHDGMSAIEAFSGRNHDLVLLDLMLPKLDGITVCKRIREDSSVPIIMLTAKSTEEDIVRGLEIGADDYVCKPFGSRELLARIRRCLRSFRNDSINDNTARFGELEVNLERRSVRLAGTVVELTKSEFTILSVLIQRPGRVLTRRQLLGHVYGDNYDGFDRSIDTHIWNLRKKLREPKGNPRYIVSEIGVGYRLNANHESCRDEN